MPAWLVGGRRGGRGDVGSVAGTVRAQVPHSRGRACGCSAPHPSLHALYSVFWPACPPLCGLSSRPVHCPQVLDQVPWVAPKPLYLLAVEQGPPAGGGHPRGGEPRPGLGYSLRTRVARADTGACLVAAPALRSWRPSDVDRRWARPQVLPLCFGLCLKSISHRGAVLMSFTLSTHHQPPCCHQRMSCPACCAAARPTPCRSSAAARWCVPRRGRWVAVGGLCCGATRAGR